MHCPRGCLSPDEKTIVIKSKDVAIHAQTCVLEPVDCSLCGGRMQRAALTKHMQESQTLHLMSVVERMKRLEEKCETLKRRNEELERNFSKNLPEKFSFDFTVNRFSRLGDDENTYSPLYHRADTTWRVKIRKTGNDVAFWVRYEGPLPSGAYKIIAMAKKRGSPDIGVSRTTNHVFARVHWKGWSQWSTKANLAKNGAYDEQDDSVTFGVTIKLVHWTDSDVFT